MKTLPPLPMVVRSLTSSDDDPLMATWPKLATVNADVLLGSTGTSPLPATLVTWIVPLGAPTKAPPTAGEEVIEIGPATRPSAAPVFGERMLPLTVIWAGLTFQKP